MIPIKPKQKILFPSNRWQLSNGQLNKIYEFESLDERNLFVKNQLLLDDSSFKNVRLYYK